MHLQKEAVKHIELFFLEAFFGGFNVNKKASPEVGGISVVKILIALVFPAPFGATSPGISPFSIEKEIEFTESKPLKVANEFLTSKILSIDLFVNVKPG